MHFSSYDLALSISRGVARHFGIMFIIIIIVVVVFVIIIIKSSAGQIPRQVPPLFKATNLYLHPTIFAMSSLHLLSGLSPSSALQYLAFQSVSIFLHLLSTLLTTCLHLFHIWSWYICIPSESVGARLSVLFSITEFYFITFHFFLF